MIKKLFFIFIFTVHAPLWAQNSFATEILKVEVSSAVSYKVSLIKNSKKVLIRLCESEKCSTSVSFDEQALEKFYFKYLKTRRALKEAKALKGRFEAWLFDENLKDILSEEVNIVNAFESLVVFLPHSIRESFLMKMKGVIATHPNSLHIDLYESNVSIDREGMIEEAYILEDFGYRAMKRYHKNKKDLRFMRPFKFYKEYLKFHIQLIKEVL